MLDNQPHPDIRSEQLRQALHAILLKIQVRQCGYAELLEFLMEDDTYEVASSDPRGTLNVMVFSRNDSDLALAIARLKNWPGIIEVTIVAHQVAEFGEWDELMSVVDLE